MFKIFAKKVLRSLKKDILKYIILALLVMLSMYLVVSIAGMSFCVYDKTVEHLKTTNAESGEFSVFVPFTDADIVNLEKNDVVIEQSFNFDIKFNDGKILRIFKDRKKINKLTLDDGRMLSSDNEIILEDLYAQYNNIKVGDKLTILEKEYTVVGVGSVPDYLNPFYNINDSMAEFEQFGIAIVTDSEYDVLLEKSKASQKYDYAFKFGENTNETKFKKDIMAIKFDYKSYMDKDAYFKEYINEYLTDINELSGGVKELQEGITLLSKSLSRLTRYNNFIISGVGDISTNIKEIKDSYSGINQGVDQVIDLTLASLSTQLGQDVNRVNYNELIDNAKSSYSPTDEEYLELSSIQSDLTSNITLSNSIKEGITALDDLSKDIDEDDSIEEYLDNVKEISDGSVELKDAVTLLLNELNVYSEETIQKNISNMTSYYTDSYRMGDDLDISETYKTISLLVGVVLCILLAYIFSIIIGHQVTAESQTIGALFALGVKKRAIMISYIILPAFFTLLGGIAGYFLGMSKLGYDHQLTDCFLDYFSMPNYEKIHYPVLIIYSTVLPMVISIIVMLLCLNKKLNKPVLKLLSNSADSADFKNIKLRKARFIQKFQLRQVIRERKIELGVFFSIFIALCLLMIGIIAMFYNNNLLKHANSDIRYNYSYSLKYPSDTITTYTDIDAEKIYIESFKMRYDEYDIDVSIYGIGVNSNLFPYETPKSNYEITISDAIATKFNVKVGDHIVMFDPLMEVNYAFTVNSIVDYGADLAAFMNINNMRELFGQDSTYYNVIFSKKELNNIEQGRILSVNTKAKIVKGIETEIDANYSFMYLLIGVASVIYIIILYLMVGVMIERSTRGISLVRIFGYTNKEIKKMYLRGILYVVLISNLIGIPVAYFIMTAAFPMIYANSATGMFLTIPFYWFIIIFVVTFIIFDIILAVQMIRVKKIPATDALKVRN